MYPKFDFIPIGARCKSNRLYQALLPMWLLLSLLMSSSLSFAANGKLANLAIADLSPAFDPHVTQYTIPKPANCSVPVTATLADPSLKLYISSNLTTSGSTRNTWVCDGHPKIEIVIYKNWTEVGHYTVTPVEVAPPPPPLPPISGKLLGLTVANLSPAFDPNVTEYTVPKPANCSVPVTATVDNPDHPNLKLYISSNPTTSGATVNTWVCDGHDKIDVVLYDVWTEVGHYTITPVEQSLPNPPSSSTPPAPNSEPEPNLPPETEPEPEPNPVPTSLPLPAASSVDQPSAVRFLEQATFGPNTTMIAALEPVGFQYWLVQQYNLPESTVSDGLNANEVINRVFLNMANGSDQLRQRMIFALSQILVVSANKNINGEELIPWIRLLSRNAFGNFRTLLKEVTLSPTMGKYLDLANSMKATATTSPNENYAREVLQLFSIGLKELNQDGTFKLDTNGQPIPTYSQQTLREFARALTGWTYPTQPGATPRSNNWEYFVGSLEPRQENHDTGAKTLLHGTILPAGQTVQQDLNGVLDNIFQHPNVPPFIATRLIRHFVTSNPTPAYIQRVADVFVDNGQGVRGDLWAVLKAILTDAEATQPNSPEHGHLKDPVLHLLGLGRALDANLNDPGMFMYLFRYLGQQVLAPATVFSFYSPLAPLPGHSDLYGPEFQIYSPGLAIQRANLIYQLLSGQLGSSFSIDLAPFIALAGSPAALVEQINQKLMYGRMSNELRQILVTATQAAPDAYNRALGALYLAAISSEYAVQH